MTTRAGNPVCSRKLQFSAACRVVELEDYKNSVLFRTTSTLAQYRHHPSCGKNAGLLKYVQEWSPGQVRKIKLTQGNGLFVPLVVHGFTVSLAFQAEDPDGWLMYNHAYGLSQLDGALLAAKRHLRERAQYDVSIMSANDKERVTALVFEGAKQLAKECKVCKTPIHRLGP